MTDKKGSFTKEDASWGVWFTVIASLSFGFWQYNIFAGVFMLAILWASIFILDGFKNDN